ncbi:hypothetical protein ESP57_00120 [Agromyces fucosus]|uniref:Uncharacterized protein n=1 Tax=Agromyces fucosus TaxID=41985 RepID=A0A4Q2JU36_9MICO|nr:hypothetical protein [Agromyces fucosus]RXZ50279.1 hypothetical protein ESP57_00120 [Agromyces fucosus]
MPEDIHGGWATRELELLYDNVLSELDNQNWASNLGLTSAALEQLAWAVTASIDYAFDVRWCPDWVRPARLTSGTMTTAGTLAATSAWLRTRHRRMKTRCEGGSPAMHMKSIPRTLRDSGERLPIGRSPL